jgi:putative acetyltransferase
MAPTRAPADILIRPFDIRDHAAAIELWQATAGIGLSSADSRENIAAYLDRNRGMSFVACQADALVGAVLGGTDGRRGYLHHLAVAPALRGRGIGRQLVARCLQALGAAGLPKCHLFLYRSNHTGRAFWEQIGWTRRNDLDVVSIELHP